MTKEGNYLLRNIVIYYGDIVEFTILNCRIRVDFAFMLILSVSALLSADNVLYILLFSIIHEAGHLIVLLIVGGKADLIRFSYYGVAMKYETKLSRAKEFAVISAGPILNFVLYLFLRDDFNLILFAINMLPVFPLDAGRLLDLFSVRLSKSISRIFIILLLVFSIYLIVKYNSFSMLLIVLYLIAYSVNY